MNTNLLNRFRNLFRKTEQDYDDNAYNAYEDYSDVVVEEPIGEAVANEPSTSVQSGRGLSLPHGAEAPAADPQAKGVHVPLAPIVADMPLELQSRILGEVGELCVFLPLEQILPQLSKGVVTLPFGKLRKAAPKLFSTDRDQDDAGINVPLSAILPHISPDMLARKHGAQQMEIPEDIVSPFADKGNGLSIGAMKQRAAAPAPKPQPVQEAPKVVVERPAPATPAPVQPMAPVPVALRAPQPVQPVQPTPRPAVARPAVPERTALRMSPPTPSSNNVSQPSIPTKPCPSVAVNTGSQQQPPAPLPSMTSKGTQILGRPTQPAAAAPAPVAPPQAAPVAAKSKRAPLSVSLSAVADAWPDSLKQEIIQLNLADANLTLPYEEAEAGLKRGRLNFTWKRLKPWINAALSSSDSASDALEVELPLRVVAPLFIAQKKERPAQTAKVAVDKDIPNLFSGLPQPETSGVAVDHSVNKPLDTNYYVWGDQDDTVPDDAENGVVAHLQTAGTEFVSRYATPNEVVSRAAALEGVEGAVIALPDGLMVASELPPGVNGDTLAAFLPHLFGKVTQCTQELRMGAVNNLNFTVGNVPWKIFRVNALYFAAFGKEGGPLPTAQVAALAGELDHKVKV